MQLKKAIWWIKRDIRIFDNQVLDTALKEAEVVIPLFCLEPLLLNSQDSSNFHTRARVQAILELNSELIKRKSGIWFSDKDCISTFKQLKEEFDFNLIVSQEEVGLNNTFQRDLNLKKWVNENNIKWIEVHRGGVIRGRHKREDRKKIWFQRVGASLIKAPENMKLPEKLKLEYEANFSNLAEKLKSFLPPTNNLTQEITEKNAFKILNSFLRERGYDYSGGISSPNTAFTAGSRLSAHLAWGTISLKTVYQYSKIKEKRVKENSRDPSSYYTKKWCRSLSAFRSRLHWRDHFIQRFENSVNMEFEAINPSYRNIPYESDKKKLDSWIKGELGVPLIDACMRCLNSTGFLNFRMRAMVTSYACHVLHISWKDLIHPLAKLFLDYEPGIHISQLQMQAGVVGINTIRVYCPKKQMIEQDPELKFTKKWVSELKDTSNDKIYNYRIENLVNYKKPIVDYKTSSKLMKDILYGLKKDPKTYKDSQFILGKFGSKRKKED